MADHSLFILTFGGIAFFMFGMLLASENLQKLTANRTRDLIVTLSKKKYLGVLLGVVLTVMIQSSGAVTAMLVGLGSAGVIQLRQVMAVILGTAVGSTFTVQLISLNIAEYGLPIFTAAFMVYFLTSKRTLKKSMGVLMGFGLIFWGLEVIGYGTAELRQMDTAMTMIRALSSNPVYAILATAFFTALVHSSAVTIGFAMSLAGSGLLDLTDAMYWVFGANIGTTATALLASMGGNYVGRQVAWAHCFYKVLGVVLFYPLIPYFAELLEGSVMARGIANFHTIYNLLIAILFYPGVEYGARAIEALFPPSKGEQEFGPKYLGRSDWESPAVAVAHAERETLRMADIVQNMIAESLLLFKDEDPELARKVRGHDDKVDLLTREIRMFLTNQLGWSSGDSSTGQPEIMRILTFTADLESAADVIDNSLREMAAKKHNLKLEFSADGWKDLELIHNQVVELSALSISCFQRQDKALASRVIYLKRQIRKLEQELREKHMNRLIKGKTETINTSSIHIDVLSEYRRIAGLMTNHVYYEFPQTESYNILPRKGGD